MVILTGGTREPCPEACQLPRKTPASGKNRGPGGQWHRVYFSADRNRWWCITVESILIVEDDGLIALYLTELMENTGYLIVGTVSTGEMVLRLLEDYLKPDLILMDIGLAGSLDGIETARRVRQKFSVPVIFVTAYTSEITLERIQEIAPEGYIGKPFLDNEIHALIRKVLDQRAK